MIFMIHVFSEIFRLANCSSQIYFFLVISRSVVDLVHCPLVPALATAGHGELSSTPATTGLYLQY